MKTAKTSVKFIDGAFHVIEGSKAFRYNSATCSDEALVMHETRGDTESVETDEFDDGFTDAMGNVIERIDASDDYLAGYSAGRREAIAVDYENGTIGAFEWGYEFGFNFWGRFVMGSQAEQEAFDKGYNVGTADALEERNN